MTDKVVYPVGDNQYISDASEAYKEAYKKCETSCKATSTPKESNTCEESTNKYDKTDMLINSLVSYMRGLHSDRTDEWLDKVLDYYSRE